MDDAQDYFIADLWHGRRVKLASLASNSILDLSGGDSADGTRVQGWEDNGSSAQRWYLYKVNEGSTWSPWVIKNAATDTWLDLSNGGSADGTAIQCWGQTWDQVRRNRNSHWFLITQQQHEASIFR
ncbi:MAG: hypothetical protein OHK93_008370 [Ramalina farinacea]|uniref:Ricin B lectin domain-containing protein n=1 Tax=Ramalina farinacea TaxID=258253 RepID=A0AA43TYG3_9LECA|nr:hypothetical protein [Ramalina farinacea]